MAWDDEGWGSTALEVARPLEVAARAIDAPLVRPLEAPALVVATPCPRVRAVEPDPGDPWARRLARWREVREALDRLPASSWPRTSPAWGWGEGDRRAPVEAGDGAAWRRLELGVRAAVMATRPRRVLVRGGRRAGKSANTCEIAVAECTNGTWGISAGDAGLSDRLVSLARRDKKKPRPLPIGA